MKCSSGCACACVERSREPGRPRAGRAAAALRRGLRDFGFEIHEFKPFPAAAPIDLAATGAVLPPVPSEEEVEAVREQLLASRNERGALAQRYRRPLQAEYAARNGRASV